MNFSFAKVIKFFLITISFTNERLMFNSKSIFFQKKNKFLNIKAFSQVNNAIIYD